MTTSNHFLRSLAKKCKDQFDRHCDQLQIIFPNKRAGIYFADELAQCYDHPIWSPSIMSFEEFVETKQSHKLADDLQMIFLLYKAYRRLVPKAEAFDAFFPWGEMILKDFNDIDNYLIDASHIFRVIQSQKELDEAFRYLSEKDQQTIQNFWKGFLPTPNKKQHEFMATWSILAELYEKFNSLLDESRLLYKGKMFNQFASAPTEQDPSTTLWFAGFNALTKAEEKIIKHYLTTASSDIFWDIDAYYFEDFNQESGTFFREYATDPVFKTSIHRDIKNTIRDAQIEIEVTSAAFSMGQIKAASKKIEALDLTPEKQPQLLMILTDESLLPAVVQSLPPNLLQANVTMGWSISQSRVYLLLLKIISLHDQYQTGLSQQIHHARLMALLEYHDLLEVSQPAVVDFDLQSIKTNQVYHSQDRIAETFPLLGQMTRNTPDVSTLLHHLTNYISQLTLSDLGEIDRAVVVLIHSTLKRIALAMDQHGVLLNFNSLYKLFQKLGSSLRLPLSGDSKEGIQIMGILETRNLSFDHVLILGMNEGHWPKDNSNTSFIPYNIRKAFDLPTLEHQDAMQSYLFYRLLHSAKHLWVSYNNIAEFNHNGELSRYIQQLDYESDLKIIRSNLVNPVSAESEPFISIVKNQEVMEEMQNYLVNEDHPFQRLSPSALNTYIDCKLKFYFQYIEKIREPDELKEDMDPSLFGNLLHGAMEYLYQDRQTWTSTNLSTAHGQLNEAIAHSFAAQQLKVDDGHTGRQMIAYEVIREYMQQILRFDEKNSPFHILGLEATDFYVDFPIEMLHGQAKVGLKGIIDRIDEYGEAVRILDYKSGRDDRSFGQMFELIDGESPKRNKAVFQLFYYCMLYKDNQPNLKRPIQPGLFNSKDLFNEDFDTRISQKIERTTTEVLNYADFEEDFKEVLLYLLTEMFNPDVPFTQTQDEQKCQYCTYRQICMKG